MATQISVDHPIYQVLLKELNVLRRLEDREKTHLLPHQWTCLTHKQLITISIRLKNECEWHRAARKSNKRLKLPYERQIWLNETEYQLWQYNHRQIALGLDQTDTVAESLVAPVDKNYYYPENIGAGKEVFITNTDCRYINTPTYVTAHKSYRANHNITSITFSQPRLYVPKTKILGSVHESEFQFLPSSTPFNVSREIESLDLEGLNLEGDKHGFKTIESVSSASTSSLNTVKDKSAIVEQKFVHPFEFVPPSLKLGAIPKFPYPKKTSPIQFAPSRLNPVETDTQNDPPVWTFPPEGPNLPNPISPPKNQLRKPLKLATDFKAKNSFLIERQQRKMEEAYQRIATLEREKAALAADLHKTTVRPASLKTERQEISDLKAQMNEMTAMMKMVTVGSNLNITTETEARLAEKFQDTVYEEPPQTYNFFITLERPTNIISKSIQRTPEILPCLKPSAIINTIGIFDPKAQPKVDFRCIWDRILDQTRNYQLYEHEYITCLRIVMKGEAGLELDGMIKEYKGDLNQILDAIQDIHVPQHTIFDEFVELNAFTRRPNEHMRTMVRRASLLIGKLRPTVSPAAWKDRQHLLLSQIIKQVIDKQTFAHLRAEELKCAQTGHTLSIEAMTSIVDFYELSKGLIPKTEIKLQYDVQSMRLSNQPDVQKTELDELKSEISTLKANILAPKRRKLGTGASLTGRFDKTNQGRKIITPKRKFNKQETITIKQEPMDTSDYSNSHPKSNIKKRPYENNSDKPKVIPYPAQKPPRFNNNDRSRQKSRGQPMKRSQSPAPSQYRALTYYTPRNNYQNYNKGYNNNRSRSKSPYRNNNYRGQYRSNSRARKSYNFQGKRHDVALNFYKCTVCPDAHENGTSCTTFKAISYTPNE